MGAGGVYPAPRGDVMRDITKYVKLCGALWESVNGGGAVTLLPGGIIPPLAPAASGSREVSERT